MSKILHADDLRVMLNQRNGWNKTKIGQAEDIFFLTKEFPGNQTINIVCKRNSKYPYNLFFIGQEKTDIRAIFIDYPNDFDALHKIEMSLTEYQYNLFKRVLTKIMKRDSGDLAKIQGVQLRIYSPTALQKCEAICRALWPKEFSN